jgi:hypothetical protein
MMLRSFLVSQVSLLAQPFQEFVDEALYISCS